MGSALGGVVSVLALAASVFVLVRTAADQDARWLASGRAGCAAVCGFAATGFLGLLPRWAFAVACVACLLAVLAVALRYGQGPSLRAYLEARGTEEEPAWWPAFEHRFRRDPSKPRWEQNPLRGAVTRPRSESIIPDRDRVADRSADVARGGRL